MMIRLPPKSKYNASENVRISSKKLLLIYISGFLWVSRKIAALGAKGFFGKAIDATITLGHAFPMFTTTSPIMIANFHHMCK